jgi:hypothetical protein
MRKKKREQRREKKKKDAKMQLNKTKNFFLII